MKKNILFIAISILAIACKKTSTPNTTIVGKWTFRNQYLEAASSPNTYDYFPYFMNDITTINNSASLEFNSNGTFTLFGPFYNVVNNSVPNNIVTNSTIGSYKIFQDSLLIIQSDTALLKSTYSYYVNTPFPKGDTIYFKSISSDSLYLLQKWSAVEQIRTDSVANVYYICLSGFKRIN